MCMGSPYVYGQPICVWAAHIGLHIWDQSIRVWAKILVWDRTCRSTHLDQLYSGLCSRLEGAVHAVQELFNEHCKVGWGLLLVGATNALYSVNRVAAVECQSVVALFLQILLNIYHGYASLLLQDGSEGILSREGVTQGYSLSMTLYAVAVLPLIHSLKVP